MGVFWLLRRDLIYLVLIIMIAAILSHFIGFFTEMLLFIVVSLLIYHFWLLILFERWLHAGASGIIPIATGVWVHVYTHFSQIKAIEKRRKKKLTKIIERFSQSSNVLPDAVVILGIDNKIEWSNQLAKLVLGIKKSNQGQVIELIVQEPQFITFIQQKDPQATVTLPSPVDHQIILQCRLVSYADNQHLLIAHDITQQQHIELMRKTFVDNISHELRTPLTVLKGYLETLHELDDKQSTLVTQSFHQMSAQTNRMQYLVDDLLLLARLETQQRQQECVNIPQLIAQICLELGVINGVERQIVLKLKTDCHLFGDEQELRSAFTNIITNALKYSPSDSFVKVIWEKTSRGLVFRVIDKGEGIASEHLSKVTERFYRVNIKRATKMSGTGLGLAIVKHVLIRHDSILEIDSLIGKGSHFRCVFSCALLC